MRLASFNSSFCTRRCNNSSWVQSSLEAFAVLSDMLLYSSLSANPSRPLYEDSHLELLHLLVGITHMAGLFRLRGSVIIYDKSLSSKKVVVTERWRDVCGDKSWGWSGRSFPLSLRNGGRSELRASLSLIPDQPRNLPPNSYTWSIQTLMVYKSSQNEPCHSHQLLYPL
jgi:hypothetical protein